MSDLLKKQEFVNTADDNTKIFLNENVYVVTLLNRETGEEERVFAVSKENNPSFAEFEEKYQVLNVETLHNYLGVNDCLFLERDFYDVDDLNSSLKEKIDKYLAMSEEDKNMLDRLAYVATNWWVVVLETVNFCSPRDVCRAMDSGYLNLFDSMNFDKKEKLFTDILKNDIKTLILSENPVCIVVNNQDGELYKRALKKSEFDLDSMYLGLERKNGEITYLDGYLKRVTLVPDFMRGFEDMFSEEELLSGQLDKQMDISDGNIFVNNANKERILLYSVERDRDYRVLKRN